MDGITVEMFGVDWKHHFRKGCEGSWGSLLGLQGGARSSRAPASEWTTHTGLDTERPSGDDRC